MDVDETNAVEELITETTGVRGSDAQILLREAYETAYRIHDHDSAESHPFDLVKSSVKEDDLSYGSLRGVLFNYHLKDVNKRFGLNLKDFLSLPREYTELILEICEEEALVEASSYEKVARQLNEK